MGASVKLLVLSIGVDKTRSAYLHAINEYAAIWLTTFRSAERGVVE